MSFVTSVSSDCLTKYFTEINDTNDGIKCHISMDSPLNLAHRCHRKAEYYLNERRYEEAIEYHLKAAQYLSEALLSTSCDKTKASLEAQKSFHLSQEKVLNKRKLCENQRIEKYRRDLKNRRALIEKFGDHNQQNQSPKMASSPTARATTDVDSRNNDMMSELMEVFSEHDSLLQFLIERRASRDQSSSVSPSDTLSTVVSSTDSIYKSGSKRPKDDKTVIEELQTVNEKLRQLVFQLYSDLEDSQKQNRALEEENRRLRDERNTISSTVPELPPLEPPELLY